MKLDQFSIRSRLSRSPVLLTSIAVAFFFDSCGTSRKSQLERVAKDWCETIRASQVMPVYPLTQDLQPGDVFLVQLPIDQQQKEWNEKGYLKLDNHIARLNPKGYDKFYEHSFPVNPQGAPLPLSHLVSTPAWDKAPRAAFPSYSFSVRKGGGLDLALPISGVPVGLSLLGSQAADGTVTIGKARTLGVDLASLFDELRSWTSASSSLLAQFQPAAGNVNYLRVVTRVYLTGELEVSLRDASSGGAGLDVQAPSVAGILTPQVPSEGAQSAEVAVTNYGAAIEALNKSLQSSSPGGSLRVTAASARSVSLLDKFDPPLVLGYLGFDCAILHGGVLGPPIPTFAAITGQIEGDSALATTPVGRIYRDVFDVAVYKMLSERAADKNDRATVEVVAELDSLGRFVPATFATYQLEPGGVLRRLSSAKAADSSGYEQFRAWQGQLASSRLVLDGVFETDRWPVRLASDGEETEVAKDSGAAGQLRQELEWARTQVEDPALRSRDDQAMRRAVDQFVFLLYSGE